MNNNMQTMRALRIFVGYSEVDHTLLTDAQRIERADAQAALLGTRPGVLLEAFMSMRKGVMPIKPSLERISGDNEQKTKGVGRLTQALESRAGRPAGR